VITAAVTVVCALASAGAPTGGRTEVLGEARTHVVRPNESIIEIAREYDLGFGELAAANPDVDPFVPDEGSTVAIPTGFVLPRAIAPGTVTVNLSEMRLYYWPAGHRVGEVVTFPIGIASEGFVTPLGTWHVVEKHVAPSWYVPASARRDDPELPAVVPPGPENPLGTHALKLSAPGILIHGTSRPFGVGRRVSRGCIRLYPEDIPRLYEIVDVGTPVAIVREPVKVGTRGGRVFVEVHDDDAAPGAADALSLLERRGLLARADEVKVRAAAAEKTGVPIDVTR
jgi:L,D-transpeptidase ErfK/SrfK